MFLHSDKKVVGAKRRRLFGRKRFLALLAALLSAHFAFYSCADNFFKSFEVENSFLENGKAVVVFSAPVDQSSAKESFVFVKDDAQADGLFYFVGNALIFEPAETVLKDSICAIHVYSGTRDIYGNTLQYDYKKTFCERSDFTKPFVVGAWDGGGFVEIEFNKDVDEISFLDSCSVQPQKEFFLEWRNGTKIARLKFKNALPEKTCFSLKIARGLKDKLNNKMENDFYWSWLSSPNALEPRFELYGYNSDSGERVLIEDTLDGADFSKGLEIVFNKEIDSESLFGALAVYPDAALDLEPRLERNGKFCKSAAIKFRKPPKWNEELLLSAGAGALDNSGAKAKERRVRLKNNSESRRPPALEFVALKIGGDFLLLDKKSPFANASFPATDFPEGQEKPLEIYFVYSISEMSSRVDRLSAMEATSVKANSCAGVELRTMESVGKKDFDGQTEFAGGEQVLQEIERLKSEDKTLCLIKCGAAFKNVQKNSKPAHGLIEFAVDEKLRDDKNNFMEEGALFACNKN